MNFYYVLAMLALVGTSQAVPAEICAACDSIMKVLLVDAEKTEGEAITLTEETCAKYADKFPFEKELCDSLIESLVKILYQKLDHTQAATLCHDVLDCPSSQFIQAVQKPAAGSPCNLLKYIENLVSPAMVKSLCSDAGIFTAEECQEAAALLPLVEREANALCEKNKPESICAAVDGAIQFAESSEFLTMCQSVDKKDPSICSTLQQVIKMYAPIIKSVAHC